MDAALWARTCVNSVTKTAGSLARTALELAERCAGELFFSKSALVKAQAFPEHSLRSEAEPAKAAMPPTWRHIQALEAAIVSGVTAQERVMACFFGFLIHTSHRSANGQTTRKLKLTEEALLGESLVKGKSSWKRWAAAREGMSVRD